MTNSAAATISRRGFVAGAAAAAGVMGISGSARAAEKEESESGDGRVYDDQADVVIVGSGMGGLSAGVQALQDGVGSVLIVEISHWTGGGSSFAYGLFHNGGAGVTIESFDEATGYEATDALSHAIADNYTSFLSWVEDLGLPVQITYDNDGVTPLLGRMLTADGEANPEGPRNFFDAFVKLYEDLGGRLMTETRATHVLTDDNGAVRGLECVESDGKVMRIGARAVILACGGFQANPELKSRYIAPDADRAACMGTPYNTGAGIAMATEVGASLQGSMSNWAGDLVPALPAKNWYEDVESFEQNGYSNDELGKWWLYSTVLSPTPAQAIWVNCDGKRFTDENLPGNTSPCAVARQQRASAIIICDSAVWEDWMSTEAYGAASPTCKEMMDVITSDTVGGKVFQADTIEDLADQLNNAGPATYKVHKTNLVQTVKEYNEAAKADKGDELFPPKAGGSAICVPLENPPFYAVPARPTIYATYGGVAIDENTQVLDISRKPIEGLYACVPTAGGAFHEAYTGCIADAGITGRMAGDAVAKAIA